ncbi:hypothetical protein EPUS_09472 [Endocarpon pusillum Z07020]|uniref:Uncharacterized protein n=1 Tax=Endocarpon pusillum (strain Z07020 / HMAS-L-300199) TaxID=1263415 RepID=U1HL65_ENDPU|nr:uncharacterized protein EPUS_09472 [Endocarpon pusillum Z07020]ERF69714.1 hypothetical protein EPUS_09472 [Endocarpon pusillum Z07020]
MSNLQSYAYPGWGEWAQKNMSFTQAIRVGDRIVCSGQGGWDARQKNVNFQTLIKKDMLEEIDQAFENVDYNLKHAGGKGWSQVYRVVTYSIDIAPQHDRIVENFRKWMPDHCPVWTELGVKQLGSDLMNIEIDVEAYDEEGAAETRKAKPTAAA